MPYRRPIEKNPGDPLTVADWNLYVRDNFISIADGQFVNFVHDGDQTAKAGVANEYQWAPSPALGSNSIFDWSASAEGRVYAKVPGLYKFNAFLVFQYTNNSYYDYITRIGHFNSSDQLLSYSDDSATGYYGVAVPPIQIALRIVRVNIAAVFAAAAGDYFTATTLLGTKVDYRLGAAYPVGYPFQEQSWLRAQWLRESPL